LIKSTLGEEPGTTQIRVQSQTRRDSDEQAVSSNILNQHARTEGARLNVKPTPPRALDRGE